jgi:hypothetical protein
MNRGYGLCYRKPHAAALRGRMYTEPRLLTQLLPRQTQVRREGKNRYGR